MNAPHDVDADLLPPILQDIAGLIGLPHTMRLVEKHGGTRLFVPKREVDGDHALVRLLGHHAAHKLIEHFGGEEHFDIPLAWRAMKAVRNAQIRAKRMHTSVRLLALEWGTTERNIRLICSEIEDDSQSRLF